MDPPLPKVHTTNYSSPSISTDDASTASKAEHPQTTLVAELDPISEPQTTLKPFRTELPHTTEVPQTTELPLTLVPQTTELPQTTDVPQTTELPFTRDTLPVTGL